MKSQKLRVRLDIRLVELGLAPSREKAQRLILAGRVLVDDQPGEKSGSLVPLTAQLRLRGEDRSFVSRGGLKLEGALDAFQIDVTGRVGLDIGASTGGFTDVLLRRGVQKVYAIDVGHSQLDWKIRSDPRVIVREKLNARYLTFEQVGEQAGIIVVDVSFISLDKILPALMQFADFQTDWVTLIKPQFEVGKAMVGKNGVVTSQNAKQESIDRITCFAETLGLQRVGLIESPIVGMEGNQEFLAHWRRMR